MFVWTVGRFGFALSMILLYGRDDLEHVHWWIASTVADLGILILLCAVGTRMPHWVLPVLAAQATIDANAWWLESHQTDLHFAATASVLVAILYVGSWWPGRPAYLYALASSVLMVLALAVTSELQSHPLMVSVVIGSLFGEVWFLRFAQSVSLYDALTGLMNRAGLQHYLELHESVGRTMLPRTLVAIDLDGLKVVNDLYGHQAGDRALTAVARTWAQELRQDDRAFRLGGDEFLMVLPQTDVAAADSMVARLRAASRIPWSCGVVDWPADESFDEAQARADSLMYEEKRRRKAQL